MFVCFTLFEFVFAVAVSAAVVTFVAAVIAVLTRFVAATEQRALIGRINIRFWSKLDSCGYQAAGSY